MKLAKGTSLPRVQQHFPFSETSQFSQFERVLVFIDLHRLKTFYLHLYVRAPYFVVAKSMNILQNVGILTVFYKDDHSQGLPQVSGLPQKTS